MKLGRGLVCWQRATSPRQMFIACWSSDASSLTPQRRSITWKRQPCAPASSRSRGKTRAWRAFRSALRSLKVELTKMRKVREV